MSFARLACLVVVVGGQGLAYPAAAEAEPPVFSTRAGAIRGYDAVAYFTEKKPVKGDKRFLFRWRDADWSFASADNLERFREDPDRYAPQFGGYCAYGMSKGSYGSTDPNAWTIHEGKLYLNYSTGVRETWGKDIDRNIKRAEDHWRRLQPDL
ncbi:MAG: YHS domain-containing protein [Myxococcales bacterium]|nr:YHS domain-containing protein [Myxococcales bacterium]